MSASDPRADEAPAPLAATASTTGRTTADPILGAPAPPKPSPSLEPPSGGTTPTAATAPPRPPATDGAGPSEVPLRTNLAAIAVAKDPAVSSAVFTAEAETSGLAATGEGSVTTFAAAAAAPTRLDTAGDFAILAGSTITNTGVSTIGQDVGLHPGSAVTGFEPCAAPAPANCVALTGTVHVADGVALQAKNDLRTAYNTLVAMEGSCTPVAVELAGRTFLPGTACSPGTFNLSAGGIVTLDAQGDPDARFIFLTGAGGSTLVTGAASQVQLIGNAQACNVFWQVASSATVGVGTPSSATSLPPSPSPWRPGPRSEAARSPRTGL